MAPFYSSDGATFSSLEPFFVLQLLFVDPLARHRLQRTR